MTELLSLYWPSVLAAALMGGALACIGALLVTRQMGEQTLALSQAAAFGVSLGLLLARVTFPDEELPAALLPTAFGLVSAIFIFLLTLRFARRLPTPSVLYLAAFALLTGLTQLLSGFFPVLESHAATLYFGDIVTTSRAAAFAFCAFAVGICLYFFADWRRQAQQAFLVAILEEGAGAKQSREVVFLGATLLLLSVSVQFLGLLFTLSCLFLPTALYAFSPRVGAGRHLLRSAVTATGAAAMGFFVSLADPRFLTTPTITLALCLIPSVHLLAERLVFRCK